MSVVIARIIDISRIIDKKVSPSSLVELLNSLFLRSNQSPIARKKIVSAVIISI